VPVRLGGYFELICGLAGIGTAVVLSSTVTLLGGWEQVSAPAMLLALPIATWEFGLGVWMMVKGFRTSPAAATTAQPSPALAVA
jgi:hypothetical protein